MKTTALLQTICTRIALEILITMTNNLTDMIFDDRFLSRHVGQDRLLINASCF